MFYSRNRKRFPCFHGNTSGRLGEREKLWKHEPKASVSKPVSIFHKRLRVLPWLYGDQERKFSISFVK